MGTFRTWEDIMFLHKNWDGPIMLKGVLSIRDAHTAMDTSMDGIVMSNHGMSRPLDCLRLCG